MTRSKVTYYAAWLVFGIAFGALCFYGAYVLKMKAANAAIAPAAVAANAANVMTAPVVTASAPPATPSPAPSPASTATFIGVLLPPQMANVASRQDGKLTEIPVKVGQTVKKGDVLAVFDSRERKQDLAMLEAQLKAAQGMAAAAGAEYAGANARAARRNANVGGVALVSIEESQQAIHDAHAAAGRSAQASAQIAETKAKIAAMKVALEDLELRAPYDGVVTAVYFEPGMNVHGNETVVRVVGSGAGLRVRVAIPEEEQARRTAKTAKLTLDDTRSFDARISRAAPEVDPASRTFLLEGEVDTGATCADCATLAGRTVRVTLAP
jgi:RND family efflux transporter MFP subunit